MTRSRLDTNGKRYERAKTGAMAEVPTKRKERKRGGKKKKNKGKDRLPVGSPTGKDASTSAFIKSAPA